jgi:ABC-2 type transport system ATP-binding protein
MTKPLVVENLKKTYGAANGKSVEALKGLSFALEPGEIFGLLGPNGAGKTTLISITTTLEKASSGEVLINGKSVEKDPTFTKSQIGVVPQEVVSSGFFNLEELLRFHSGFYGIKNNEPRIKSLLNRLGLEEHKHKVMRQLSGGMKRRMMIAKALVNAPKILLLDEPTAGVDVQLRTQLWEFVRELQKEGVTILLTTHYLEEAEQLCGRVGIINKGELKYCGATRDIITKLSQKMIDVTMLDGSQHHLELEPNKALAEALLAAGLSLAQVKDIRSKEGTLEEAFLKVLRT